MVGELQIDLRSAAGDERLGPEAENTIDNLDPEHHAHPASNERDCEPDSLCVDRAPDQPERRSRAGTLLDALVGE